jgi:pyruvate-formate lyase-activating enzyme
LKDIVLLSPPSRAINHYRPPLALMYVAEWYRRQGLQVKIIDPKMTQVVRNKSFWNNKDELLQKIHDDIIGTLYVTPCKTIGISCYSTEIGEVRNLVRNIRSMSFHKHQGTKIIVGGVGPTLFPDDFKGWTDGVVRGRLDVGFPAYDLVDMPYYTNANPYAIRGVYLRATYVLSSMGCPSNCSFCVAPKLREHYKVGYIKSPRQLSVEVGELKEKYGIDGFYIIDDLFTIDKGFVKEFCCNVKSLGLLWGCSSRVNTVDELTIKAMSESGCIQMDFGVERGSDEELKRIRKGQSLSRVKETFELCRRYKVRTFANFIVGLPEERQMDRDDIKNTVKEISPTITSFNLFEPYPGTELYSKGIKEVNYDLLQWVKKSSRQNNSIWKNLQTHLSGRYWKVLFKAKKKLNYISQLWSLIAELVNQSL